MDLKSLSVNDVAVTLRNLNVPDTVVQRFKQEQINGNLFIDLDDEMLQDIGVGRLFHRQKIIRFIEGWRPDDGDPQ